jgi:hypothetical protein
MPFCLLQLNSVTDAIEQIDGFPEEIVQIIHEMYNSGWLSWDGLSALQEKRRQGDTPLTSSSFG